MENSRPRYSKPVIVDLDDPDDLYASGACNPGSSPQGWQCKPTGWFAGNRCAAGWIANNCGQGSAIY
jgi:hypothetical protein